MADTTVWADGGLPRSPKLAVYELPSRGVRTGVDARYMPIVGRPRPADKWVRPLSSPTIRLELASTCATSVRLMRGSTSALGLPATSFCARAVSSALPDN